MSHEIEKTDGLVLTKNAAWHGLGTIVDSAPTAKDALSIAGIGWTVGLVPMFAEIDGLDSELNPIKNRVQVSDKQLAIRSDNGGQLGVVGMDYKPVNNSELAALVDSLAVVGNAKIETAGTFRGGRRVFFLVQTDSIFVNPADEVKNYLLVSSSHDGTLAMSARPTDVRVVCKNTFVAACGADKAVASFRHSGNIDEKMARCRDIIAGAAKARQVRAQQYAALDSKQLNTSEIQSFFVEVYNNIAKPIPANPSTKEETRARDKAAKVLAEWSRLFDADRLRTNGNASVWCAMNAVTEWVDHYRPVHGDTDRDESRLFNVRNNANKDSVLSLALARL